MADTILHFPYTLDTFQKQSIDALYKGDHVLVTAHTSAGKSTIAEFAVALALSRDQRVIYTSPIKALSNQKYGQFRAQAARYGVTPDDVGILTGDIKINPDAKILVATTEIVRNRLFAETAADDFANFGALILDEVHYIKDRERGHIWEETIAMTPNHILLVMLSASIGEANLLSDWVSRIKSRPARLITTTFRPVPLEHYYFHHHDREIHPIMDNAKHMTMANYFPDRPPVKPPGQKPKWKELHPTPIARMKAVIDYVQRSDLTPCLVFSFSRKKCETYAHVCDTHFVEGKESIEAVRFYDYNVQKFIGADALRIPQVAQLRDAVAKGVAIHHSGLIPILKEVVEQLFERKLVKLLFVTETFAVGINMPTRCVVFSELQKWDGIEDRLVAPEEYLQMAGRAGRRGLDKRGVVIYAPFEKPLNEVELRRVLAGAQQGLTSRFAIDPTFVLHCMVSANDPMTFTEKTFYRSQFDDYLAGLEEERSRIGAPTQSEQLSRLIALDAALASKRSQRERKQNRREARALREELGMTEAECERAATLVCEGERLDREINDARQFYTEQFATTRAFLESLELCRGDAPTCAGLVAACFKEMPDVLGARLLLDGCLDDLEGASLLAVLCALVDDRTLTTLPDARDDPESLETVRRADAESLPSLVIERCQQIQEILDHLQSRYEETGFGLSFALSIGFSRYGMLWWTKDSYVELCAEFAEPIYAGNFVKNMLKVHALIDEFASACQLADRTSLIPQLHEVQMRVLHDIVTIDSLYLHTT